MPPMTIERVHFDMIYMNGKVYAVGGYGGSGSQNSMDIFDTTTKTWTKRSTPFSGYGHCISQLSENQFILIGGQGSSEVSKNVMKKNISIQQLLFYISQRKVFLTKYLF